MKRRCDRCGQEKELKGGKTCETGHFICKSCHTKYGWIVDTKLTKCPLCEKPLR